MRAFIATLLSVSLLAPAGLLSAEKGDRPGEIEWSFNEDRIGGLPKGFKVDETSGTGTRATWKIVADGSAPSKSQIVALTESKNSGQTYNLLIAEKTQFKDLEVEVMVKALGGKEDQGGGPIWRAKDENNYYISRWNPLEDNFRVYFVKDGRRKQIGTATVAADPTAWHKIRIEHRGNRIVAEFDGKKFIELKDDTFQEAGMVGLWTKADATTGFDDFEVEVAND